MKSLKLQMRAQANGTEAVKMVAHYNSAFYFPELPP